MGNYKLCPKCRESKKLQEFICNRGTELGWCSNCFYAYGWTSKPPESSLEDEGDDKRTKQAQTNKKEFDAIRAKEREYLLNK